MAAVRLDALMQNDIVSCERDLHRVGSDLPLLRDRSAHEPFIFTEEDYRTYPKRFARATVAFPTSVTGPVDRSHGRQFFISSAWCKRRSCVQPFAMLFLLALGADKLENQSVRRSWWDIASRYRCDVEPLRLSFPRIHTLSLRHRF